MNLLCLSNAAPSQSSARDGQASQGRRTVADPHVLRMTEEPVEANEVGQAVSSDDLECWHAMTFRPPTQQ